VSEEKDWAATEYEFEPVRDIPLDQLDMGDKNVRTRNISTDIDGLAHSMLTFGLQQPIIVQQKDGRYEIIIGQRRYLAAKRLEWKTIPARVRKTPLDEFQGKVISFSENIQRRDLSARDKADACSYLLQRLGTPRDVAEHLGITEVTVRKWLKFAEVPEGLKKLVDNGVISSGEANRLFQWAPTVDKAIDIASRMATIRAPRRARERVFESLEEAPHSSVDAIFRRADEKRRQKEIRFILPEKWAFEIEKAAKRLNTTPEEIARDATIEWLQMLRY